MHMQISYWAFRDGASGRRSIGECIDLARRAGFDGIELAVSADGELTPDTAGRECRTIACRAEAAGLRLGSVASGLLWEANPASADLEVRARALDITKKSLRVTAELGAECLLVLPGHVFVSWAPGGEVVPYDDCYARSLDFCRAVGKEAERLGVVACVENVWNGFLLSPMEFARFLDEVGSPAVKAYLDVGNVWNNGYPQHWIKILDGRIGRVHVKDFRRSVATLAGFCQLNEGDVPLAESLKLLAKLGYEGPITAEVFSGPGDENEATFLDATRSRLQGLLL